MLWWSNPAGIGLLCCLSRSSPARAVVRVLGAVLTVGFL